MFVQEATTPQEVEEQFRRQIAAGEEPAQVSAQLAADLRTGWREQRLTDEHWDRLQTYVDAMTCARAGAAVQVASC